MLPSLPSHQGSCYSEVMMIRKSTALLAAVALTIFTYLVASALPMSEALSALPRDLSDTMLLFTNWSQIKDNLGLENVTSGSPSDARIEFARRCRQELSIATAFGIDNMDTHADMWGWDASDLDWEAQLVSSVLPPIYVLKLRGDFDFSLAAVGFTERGFVQTDSHGALLFSNSMDPGQPWLRTTELAILNTAYIADEQLMILSSSPVALGQSLATWADSIAGLDEDPFAVAAVEHLGAVDSAILLRGLGECIRFTPNPILDLVGNLPTSERIEKLRVSLQQRELLVPYRAFGTGYEDVEGARTGTIVFEYDSADLALLDMPARLLLAEEGMSTCYEAPIAETYFSVHSCEVLDNAIVMSVTPVANQPIRLFRMMFYLDAVFAGCSM